MEYNNKQQYSSTKPYKAHNMMVKKMETVTEPPAVIQPENNNDLQDNKGEVGYINVAVYTALGALPVKDAVVTVYLTSTEGEEQALYHVVTNASGRAPKMEVPVIYEQDNPLESSEFYFSTYNMLVQAIGYYTVNVIDLRVFPNVATNYKVVLIPVMEGGTEDESGQVIVIPPIPADISNE